MYNLDQCSVHLYADDTEITCKYSVKDLGRVITNNLKRDSLINLQLSKAQQKLFFLKRTVPFLTNTRVKVSFYKNLYFFNSPLRVKCMVLELTNLQKTRNDAKTSSQVGFERNFLPIVTTIRASFTTICCQSVSFWFELILLR